MLKINPIKTMTFVAALTTSVAIAAQNRLQTPQRAYLTEEIRLNDKGSKDEFVSQSKEKNSVKTYNTNIIKNDICSYNSTNSDFYDAVDFYNDKMSSDERYSVTRNAYDNMTTRLYNMEKAIDKAYQECEAYSDIVIVPRWHYRFYPSFNDRLISFDIDEVRTRTTKDMESLYELRDKAAYIIERANGITTHEKPEKTNYNVDEIAQKYLGMSYYDFKEKYKGEIEDFKNMSYANLQVMDSKELDIYNKTKAYATEMLNTTINEAHTVNWDIGEKKLDETTKISHDMYTISDFEYDGITTQGLAEIESGIAFKAFEDELISKYDELNDETTSVKNAETDEKQNKSVKRLVNGNILIYNPDGSIYDMKGSKIK